MDLLFLFSVKGEEEDEIRRKDCDAKEVYDDAPTNVYDLRQRVNVTRDEVDGMDGNSQEWHNWPNMPPQRKLHNSS